VAHGTTIFGEASAESLCMCHPYSGDRLMRFTAPCALSPSLHYSLCSPTGYSMLPVSCHLPIYFEIEYSDKVVGRDNRLAM